MFKNKMRNLKVLSGLVVFLGVVLAFQNCSKPNSGGGDGAAAPAPEAQSLPPTTQNVSVTLDEDTKVDFALKENVPSGQYYTIEFKYPNSQSPLPFDETKDFIDFKEGRFENRNTPSKLRFVPAKDFNGPLRLNYRVRTTKGPVIYSDWAALDFVINPVDDLPLVKVASSYKVLLNTSLVLKIDDLFVDIDKKGLQYEVLSTTNGVTGVNPTNLTFTPNTNFIGDASGAGATAVLRLKLPSGKFTDIQFNFVIVNTNAAPEWQGESSFTLKEDEVFEKVLTATDAEKDNITFTAPGTTGNSSITLSPLIEKLSSNSAKIFVKPPPHFFGKIYFDVYFSDGISRKSKTITLEYQEVPSPLEIFSQKLDLDQNKSISTALGSLVAVPDAAAIRKYGYAVGAMVGPSAVSIEDSFLSTALTISTLPKNGEIKILGDGPARSIVYTPKVDFFGTDAATLEIFDLALNKNVPINLSFEVHQTAPLLEQISDKFFFEKGKELKNFAIAKSSQGNVEACNINPKLPAGLVMNDDCTSINGIPTALSQLTSYTVSAFNKLGNSQQTIAIAVNDVPPLLSSFSAPFKFRDGAPFSIDFKNGTGGKITECKLLPEPGLGHPLYFQSASLKVSADGRSCVFSGTTKPSHYGAGGDLISIQASNSGGSSGATVRMVVLRDPKFVHPEGFSFEHFVYGKSQRGQYEFRIDDPPSRFVLIPDEGYYGEPVTSCVATPNLPSGVSIASNCDLTVNTSILGVYNFSVTASSWVGSIKRSFVLKVVPQKPTLLPAWGYYVVEGDTDGSGRPVFLYRGGEDISNYYRLLLPTWKKDRDPLHGIPLELKGLAVTCSAFPTLPEGMKFDPKTCSVTGAPLKKPPGTVYGPVIHTIKASNVTGSASMEVKIKVEN